MNFRNSMEFFQRATPAVRKAYSDLAINSRNAEDPCKKKRDRCSHSETVLGCEILMQNMLNTAK